MTRIAGRVSVNSNQYFGYYFTSGQWRYYYASGLSIRGNRITACSS